MIYSREVIEAVLVIEGADLSWVYKNGRPTKDQLPVRDVVDAALLKLQNAGLNMARVGRVFGLCEKTVDRALARARA